MSEWLVGAVNDDKTMTIGADHVSVEETGRGDRVFVFHEEDQRGSLRVVAMFDVNVWDHVVRADALGDQP